MTGSIQTRIGLDALTQLVQTLACEFQFEMAGVAAIQNAPELDYFADWLAEGRAGDMQWLAARNDAGELKRSALQAALPWARSVVVCAASYDSPAPLSTDPAPATAGWIARYAQPGSATGGPADYHDVLLARLRDMEDALHRRLDGLAGDFQSRSYVDTGPLIERVYAQYAGLGWVGKNTCLIHPERGSWFFLAAIVTSLDVADYDPNGMLQPDRCGSCTRCIDACPTGALAADNPYRMDASKCIAYLTIEKKGSIPLELREGIGRNVFGCDICQDVCPWNGKTRRKISPQPQQNQQIANPATPSCNLHARAELVNPDLGWLGSQTPQLFRERFRGSPLERTKWRGVMRNVAMAMGNSGCEEYLPQLDRWATLADEPVLAEAAQWAFARIMQSRQQAKDVIAAGVTG